VVIFGIQNKIGSTKISPPFSRRGRPALAGGVVE